MTLHRSRLLVSTSRSMTAVVYPHRGLRNPRCPTSLRRLQDSPRNTRRLVAAALGVLLVATLGGAVWFALSRDGGSGPGEDPGQVGHGVDFNLTVSRVGVRTIAPKLS